MAMPPGYHGSVPLLRARYRVWIDKGRMRQLIEPNDRRTSKGRTSMAGRSKDQSSRAWSDSARSKRSTLSL